MSIKQSLSLLAGIGILLIQQAAATPLHQAIRSRDAATVRSILETAIGTALDQPIQDGITPLHLAAATDQPDVCRMLLERGASVNIMNKRGFTPLHWAASQDSVATIDTLITFGADPNARAASNITPLHWAANKNAANAIGALLNHGADPTIKTDQGFTPLHLAVRRNANSESAILLAKHQADNMQDLPPDLVVMPQAPQTPPVPLPDAPEELTPPVLPGMFLNVALGLGDVLNFVWLEERQIWFGKYEISNAKYRRFDPSHTSRRVEGISLDEPDQPAVFISWNEATNFCDWLNANFGSRIPEGYVFRLPTEAEWMLAASMGDGREFPWGNDWPPLYGNFPDATARAELSQWRGIEGYDDGHAVTAPVEQSGMNALGIFGLAGNVWEWTQDWMDPEAKTFKIRKGGSWDFDTRESLRIAARGLDRPNARYDTIGFRIVVAPQL